MLNSHNLEALLTLDSDVERMLERHQRLVRQSRQLCIVSRTGLSSLSDVAASLAASMTSRLAHRHVSPHLCIFVCRVCVYDFLSSACLNRLNVMV
jgi:uncharacterized protein (UPF0276 family)